MNVSISNLHSTFTLRPNTAIGGPSVHTLNASKPGAYKKFFMHFYLHYSMHNEAKHGIFDLHDRWVDYCSKCFHSDPHTLQ